jgi:hypothetical protein
MKRNAEIGLFTKPSSFTHRQHLMPPARKLKKAFLIPPGVAIAVRQFISGRAVGCQPERRYGSFNRMAAQSEA